MFCSACGTANDASARFCQSCGAGLAAAAAPAPQYVPPPPPPQPDPRMRGVAVPTPPGQVQHAAGKSPGVALVLSLIIVGLGQFYNGDTKKGAIMFVCAIVAAMITFGLGWFAIAIWSAIDAYQVAQGKSPLW